MLETKFKVAMWLTVLFMASLPIMGILRGTKLTPFEPDSSTSTQGVDSSLGQAASNTQDEKPIAEDMIRIPAGDFHSGNELRRVR